MKTKDLAIFAALCLAVAACADRLDVTGTPNKVTVTAATSYSGADMSGFAQDHCDRYGKNARQSGMVACPDDPEMCRIMTFDCTQRN